MGSRWGIILSYVWILIGITCLNWNPVSLFISFLVEFALLAVIYISLLIYSIVTRTAGRRSRDWSNLFLAIAVFIIFHYFLIFLLMQELHVGNDLSVNPSHWLDAGMLGAVGLMILSQVLSLTRFSVKHLASEYRRNIFIGALTITGTQMLGVVLVLMISISWIYPVLITLIVVRFFLEWLLDRWIKE